MSHHGTNFGVLALGLVFAVFGLASVVLAITDFRHWLSAMYENNRNRKTGFGAVSDSPTSYRRWIGGFGAVFFVFGILAVVHA